MSRISIDEYYLNIAKAVSLRSTCLRRQYGAVIVNNDEIIATGYNGSPRGEVNCCDINYCPRINAPHNSGNYGECVSVHAEQNAILSASRRDTLGGKLYLAGFDHGEEVEDIKPCPICLRMIKNAGLTVITKNGELNYED